MHRLEVAQRLDAGTREDAVGDIRVDRGGGLAVVAEEVADVSTETFDQRSPSITLRTACVATIWETGVTMIG